MSDNLERYSRQMYFADIGEEGQRKLLAARVVQVGCGALGSTMANLMVRAGIGDYTIIDRDFTEMHNLQRQTLYDEEDVQKATPKAVAAAERLRKVNSGICIRALVTDLHAGNAEALLKGAHLVMDATDNMSTRYLINDYCVREGVPWIYGGVVGSSGMTMNVLPGKGPCLRCIFFEPPAAGQLPTVDTVGILNSMPSVIASIQVSEAIKILIGSGEYSRDLVCVDLWHLEMKNLKVARNPGCQCCGKRTFTFLETKKDDLHGEVVGRGAIQVTPPEGTKINLPDLERVLSKNGQACYNGHLLTAAIEQYELIVFPDGRALIKGARDQDVAKDLYRRYVKP